MLEICPPLLGTPPVIADSPGVDPTPSVDDVVPCVPLIEFGRYRFVWLNTLYASARNSIFIDSIGVLNRLLMSRSVS